MAVNRLVNREPVNGIEVHAARIAEVGCSRHPHLLALLDSSGPTVTRDLTDAVHLLCALHGRHPGLVEIAYSHADAECGEWLGLAASTFERERLFLVRLTAAVGPLPSTPGSAETESSLVAQRNALEILVKSERRGCSIGAVTALIGDWWSVRRILDRAATRAGIDCPPPSLPDEASIAGILQAVGETPAGARAMAFGCEQLLLQHRALFDLLEARSEARQDY